MSRPVKKLGGVRWPPRAAPMRRELECSRGRPHGSMASGAEVSQFISMPADRAAWSTHPKAGHGAPRVPDGATGGRWGQSGAAPAAAGASEGCRKPHTTPQHQGLTAPTAAAAHG